MPELDDELDLLLASQEAAAPPTAVPALPVAAPTTPPVPGAATPTPEDAEMDALLGGADPVAAAQAAEAARPVAAPRRFNLLSPEGELSNVGAANLDEAYRQGFRLDASELPTAGPVRLLEGGKVNTYDAADPTLQDRMAAGAQLATPAEVEREFGDIGSQIATGAEHAAQGATFGGYKLAAEALAGPEYTADYETRGQVNPVTAVAGELVGAVAPALATGGSGTLARAATFTPVGALSRGSQLAGRLAESLAPRLATTTAGRVGLTAALAAGEGAIDNATRQVLDDIGNDNVDVTAERMLDSAVEGMKWGGLFGGGGALIGEGLSKLGKRGAAAAADEAVPGHFDEAFQIQEEAAAMGRPRAEIDADLDIAHQRLAEADAGGNPAAVEEAENTLSTLMKEQEGAVLRDAGARTDADLEVSLKVAPPPEAQGILAKLDAQLNTAKNARDIGLKFDDVTDDLTRSITDDVDNLQRYYQNDLGPQISRNNKPKAIKAALEQEGVQWTEANAERVLRENEQAIKYLDELRDEYVLGDEVAKRKLGPIKAARTAIEGVQARLTGIKGAGPVGPVAPGSRILRHDLDAIADIYWHKDSLKSYLGAVAKNKGEVMTPAEAAIQKIYMRERASLQDPKLYGSKLAEMQTVTNAAESRAIPAQRVFQSKFGASDAHRGERAGEHGFDVLREADPKRTKGFVKALGEADAYKDERDFVAGLTRQLEMAEAKAKYYPVDPESAARLTEARATVEALTDKLRTAKELNLRKMQAQRAVAEGSPIQEVVQGLRAMPWGASITGTVSGVARGVGEVTRALAQGAVKAERAVEGAAKKTARNFFRGTGEKLSRPIGGIGITANAVRKAVEEAEALQNPNSTVAKNLNNQVRALREESPELAQALEAKVRQRAALILSKAGPRVDDSDPFQPGRRPPMDRITEMRLARYVEASQNIDKVLGRLAEGTASLEDMEVLKANRPQQFQRYVQKVQAEMANAKQPPDPQARARLHLMLGVPMSREQTPEALQRYARMAPPPPQQKAPPKPKGPRFTFGSRESFGARSDQLVSEGDG